MIVQLFRQEKNGKVSERLAHCSRYSNANYYASAVVAVTSYFNGELFDWAAYWGGCPADVSQEEGIRHVAEHGDKMFSGDAAYFFPALPIERYRA